jgi:hypothetical protein
MTDKTATLDVVTRDPLRAGEKQSLALRIATQGFRSVFLRVPLGTDDAALMSREAFGRCRLKYAGKRPQGVGDITQQADDGAFRVPILAGPGKALSFDVAIEGFQVAPEAGTATLALHGDTLDPPAVATAPVAKRSTPPSIESFTADAYTVIAGEPVTLEWTLSEATDFVLVDVTGGTERVITEDRAKTGRLEVDPAARGSDYALRLLQGGEILAARQLRIHAFDATGFHVSRVNAKTDAPIAGILGLHAFAGRLYALLRTGDDRVELWYTTHGFDPRAWQPELNGRGEVIALSVAEARRPGVVFDGKLWLIGGDCCDPDAPGSEIGFYDFQATAWSDVGPEDARRWPAGMRERMGHAVVRAPFGDGIWVMGGWSQDGGLCNDVWAFNGNAWNQVPGLDCEACLFGATTTLDAAQPAAWRFGGFLEPGGRPSPTILQAYDRNGGTTVSDVRFAAGSTYCASALFAPDRKQKLPYGICTLYNSKEKGYRHHLIDVLFERSYGIDWNDIGNPSASGVLLSRDYSHLQAAEFNGATFFRVLVPDRDWPAPQDKRSGQMSYLVRVDRTFQQEGGR